MNNYYTMLSSVINQLKASGIEPIIYGSLAVSFYLGKYKQEFVDFDLLVSDEWLEARWPEFQLMLKQMSYDLIDEHEHEFTLQVAGSPSLNFAKISILERDNICRIDETTEIKVGNHVFRTLTAKHLLQAYRFSEKDGYRKEKRGKKDAHVIKLLNNMSSRKR